MSRGRSSFIIVTPSYIKDYRQEYFILNHYKEREYLIALLIGLLLLAYGFM
jgi:hypothetical protein